MRALQFTLLAGIATTVLANEPSYLYRCEDQKGEVQWSKQACPKESRGSLATRTDPTLTEQEQRRIAECEWKVIEKTLKFSNDWEQPKDTVGFTDTAHCKRPESR